MKKRYIGKIKLNGKTFINLICNSKGDYIFSFPKSSDILDEGGYFRSHLTLHIQNNRLTWKVTDFGNSTKDFSDVLGVADKEGFYVSRNQGLLNDIDLLKGERYLDLEDPTHVGKVITFAERNIHKKGSGLDFFSDPKNDEKKFSEIINLQIPKKISAVELNIYAAKNIKYNLNRIYNMRQSNWKSGCFIQDNTKNAKYTFVVIVEDSVFNPIGGYNFC